MTKWEEKNLKILTSKEMGEWLSKRGNILFDNIKSEITHKQFDYMTNKDYDEGIRFGLMLACQVVDKYISKEVIE